MTRYRQKHVKHHFRSPTPIKTTRLLAPWIKPDGITQWSELARPQVLTVA